MMIRSPDRIVSEFWPDIRVGKCCPLALLAKQQPYQVLVVVVLRCKKVRRGSVWLVWSRHASSWQHAAALLANRLSPTKCTVLSRRSATRLLTVQLGLSMPLMRRC